MMGTATATNSPPKQKGLLGERVVVLTKCNEQTKTKVLWCTCKPKHDGKARNLQANKHNGTYESLSYKDTLFVAWTWISALSIDICLWTQPANQTSLWELMVSLTVLRMVA